MKRFLSILCAIGYASLSAQTQKTFKVEVDQKVNGPNLELDVYIQKTSGADFSLASTNFSFFVNNTDLDLANVSIDHGFDGPFDNNTHPGYFDLTKGKGSNYLVLNVNQILSTTSLGQKITSNRTRIGRLLVPILNHAGFNTLTWRIAPLAMNDWNLSSVKAKCEFVNPTPDFPLCQVPNKPLLTTPNLHICGNQTASISANGNGNITWLKDGIEITGQNGNNLIVSQSGVYTAFTTSYSCKSPVSEPIEIVYDVAPTPLIAGTNSGCLNQIFTLQTPFVAGNTYTWSAVGGQTSVNQNQVSVQYATAGNYTVQVMETNPAGCSEVNTFQVAVSSSPIQPIITQNGSELISSVTSNIQWYLNGNPIPNANNSTYLPTADGSYTIVYSSSCGVVTSNPFTITLTSTIDPALSDEFKVYPNPYKGQTFIHYTLLSKADVKLEVFNMLGQPVQTIVAESQVKGTYKYDFSAQKLGLSAGSYMIKLSVNNSSKSVQVLEIK